MNRLSDEQYQIIRNTVQMYGTLGYAAERAGISLSYLKRVIADDDGLAQEIADMQAMHSENIYMMALQRAEKSDTILGKLLEARVDGFSGESRKQALQQTGRPNRLVLRTFDDNGNEAGVQDVAPKQQSGPPLQIALDRDRI